MGYFININKLYGKKEGDTSLSKAKEVYQGKTKRLRLCKGLTIVYDEWVTTFSASHFNVPASGGNVEDYITVSSYGTDYDGIKHDMEYKLSIETIPVNTSPSSRTINVTVTQLDTDEEAKVICTQAGNVTTTTYGTPTITKLTYSDVAANGSGGNITISYSQQKVVNDASGTTTTTITGTTTPTSVTVSPSITGFGYSTTKGLYGPDCGTTSTSRRKLGTISSISFSANRISATASRSDVVYQRANTRTSTVLSGGVDISVSPTSIGTNGGLVTVTATSEKTIKWTYASGDTENETTHPNITINCFNATFTTTDSTSVTIASGNSVTAEVTKNGGVSARSVTFNASADSYTDSASVNQSGASYEFTLANTTDTSLPAEGGNPLAMVVSKKNGDLLDISTSNVSINNPWLSVKSAQYATSSYYIEFEAPANTSTSSRSATVTITQPESGKTVSFTVTQAGAEVIEPDDEIVVNFNASVGENDSIDYSINVTSGSIQDVEVSLGIGGSIFNSKSHGDMEAGDTITDYILNTADASDLEVNLHYNGVVQQTINLKV